MRYALRNQDKIKEVFGQDFLNTLHASLFLHFQSNTEIKAVQNIGDKFPSLKVKNITKYPTFVYFEVYVISITYDVYLLAYKGAVNE